MATFLAKTEPSEYSFSQLVRDKKGIWDGVRNHEAKRNLGLMSAGDRVLIQHTGTKPAVVGVAVVSRAAFADPKDPAWLAVELTPEFELAKAVTLATLRSDPLLSDGLYLKRSRLSVVPVTWEQFRKIIKLGGRKTPEGITRKSPARSVTRKSR